ncbi:MAG: hypothetical protein GEV03_11785 [Streptosporangiales bacterium]|nr:hypothetical protein [Streptosporangiales bacterium]
MAKRTNKAKKRLSWREFFLSLLTGWAALFVIFFVLIGIIVGLHAGYRLLFSDSPLTAQQLIWRLQATAGGAALLAVFWTLFSGVRLLFDPVESPWRGAPSDGTGGKPTMRGFFKIAVIAGVPFGVLLGLANGIEEGSVTAFVVITIVAGVMFGVPMAAIVTAAQWWKTRRARKRTQSGGGAAQPGIQADRPLTLAERTVIVRLPLPAAYQKCVDAATALFGAGNVRVARDSGAIEVRTGTSWKSWGENLTLELSPDDDAITTVTIRSHSSVSTTVLDYGKNSDNVDRVAGWLLETEDGRYRDSRYSPR